PLRGRSLWRGPYGRFPRRPPLRLSACLQPALLRLPPLPPLLRIRVRLPLFWIRLPQLWVQLPLFGRHLPQPFVQPRVRLGGLRLLWVRDAFLLGELRLCRGAVGRLPVRLPGCHRRL